MVRHGSGFIRVALTGRDCDRLQLPLMHRDGGNSSPNRFTVSFDAAFGVTTGISAQDRATTLSLLTDPNTSPVQLHRPGHVVGIRTHDQGVLGEPGPAESVIDLLRLADLHAAGAVCELIGEGGGLMQSPELEAFTEAHDLVAVAISELVAYRQNPRAADAPDREASDRRQR